MIRPPQRSTLTDNSFPTRRASALLRPDFTPLGTFGTDQLRSPYGLWIHESAPGEYEVYVTDSFMEGEQYDVVPPLDQLDRRVRRYRVTFADPMHFLVR